MSILNVPVTQSSLPDWVRKVANAINQLIFGKQDANDNLTSIAGLTLTGNEGDAIVVNGSGDGFELAAGGGGGGTTTNALTFDSSGSGAASGSTFDGSSAVTVSYNSVGAAASGHNHDASYQPLDADLTAVAALTTDAAGRSVLTLADPGADRIAFWDDSAGAMTWLSLSPLLEISGTTLQPKFSGAKVRKSATLSAQNLTAGASVTWNTEDWDTDAYHDTGSNTERLTAAVAGYYETSAYIRLASVTSGDPVQAAIQRFNSSAVFQETIATQRSSTSTTTTHHNPYGQCHMDAGDYLIVVLLVSSDTSVDIHVDSNFLISRLA